MVSQRPAVRSWGGVGGPPGEAMGAQGTKDVWNLWQDLPSCPPAGFKSLTFLPSPSLKEKKVKQKGSTIGILILPK